MATSFTETDQLLDKSQIRSRNRGPLLRDEEFDGTSAPDQLEGTDGDELIDAGGGSDEVSAGAGSDSVEGGKGDDALSGGKGDDQVEGGSGDDLIKGEVGDDLLEGDNGDDTLKGGKGEDTLNGGEGDDLLVGGGGGDVYVLSTGNDTIQGYKAGDQIVLSQELVDAGLSHDAVVVERTTIDGKEAAFLRFEIDGESFTTTVIGISEQPVLEIEEKSDYDLVVNGSEGDDITNGDNEAYPIDHDDRTSKGTETWFKSNSSGLQKFEPVKEQRENIDGKGGDDYIFANKGNDYIEGGSGNDTLYGNRGSDDVLGGAGNDKVYGNKDDDTVRGGLGDDTLNGNDGNDRLVSDQDNDQLYGNDGADTLLGGDGNDTLNGGGGDDEMFGEEGNDKFKASPGDDKIKDFYFGNDKLVASTDYEWDAGSIRTNDAVNSATINVLNKVSGAVEGTTTVNFKDEDNFNAFLKELNGSPNSEFPPIGASDPDTTLEYLDNGKDFKATGGKMDNLITVEEINEFSIYYYDDEKRYFVTSTSNPKFNKPKEATLSNSYSIDGFQGDDTIKGGDQDDYLHGNVGDDKLEGGNGNDKLDGGNEDDTLEGGDGNDTLIGGSGNDLIKGQNKGDTLEGEKGDDTLEGGSGYDSLSGGDGNDIVDGGSYSDTLKGGDDNDTLIGGSGNDDLIAGPGQDYLDGGKGNDYYDGGGGSDVFTLSEGTDVIKSFKGSQGDTITEFPSEGKIVEFIRASELEERPIGLDQNYQWTDSSALVRFTLSDDADAEIHTTYILDFDRDDDLTWDTDININTLVAPGLIAAYEGSSAPDGWFFLNGETKTFDVSKYPLLADNLGSTKLPDFSGRFLVQQGYSDELQAATTEKDKPAALGAELPYLTALPEGLNQTDTDTHSFTYGDENQTRGNGGNKTDRNGAQPPDSKYREKQSTLSGSHNHNLEYSGGDKATHPKARAVNWIIKHDYTNEKRSEIIPEGIIFARARHSTDPGWTSVFTDDVYLVGSGESVGSKVSFEVGKTIESKTADPITPFELKGEDQDHSHGVRDGHGVHGTTGGKALWGGKTDKDHPPYTKDTDDHTHEIPSTGQQNETHPDSVNVQWVKFNGKKQNNNGIEQLLPDGIVAAWLSDKATEPWTSRPDWAGRYLRGTDEGLGELNKYSTKNVWNFEVKSSGSHQHSVGDATGSTGHTGDSFDPDGSDWQSTAHDHSHKVKGGDRTTRPDSVVVDWIELQDEIVLDLCNNITEEPELTGTLTIEPLLISYSNENDNGETVRVGGSSLLEKYRYDLANDDLPVTDCPNLPRDIAYNISSGSGHDVIEGGTASDTLRGNAGNDVIQGHQGDNTLIGDSGEDELYSGTGKDRMDGGADDDHLWGSKEETGQSNTFVISEGNDVFFDFNLDSDFVEFDGRARDLRFAPTSYGDDIESTLITRLDGKGTTTLVGISVENFLGHKPYPPIILPIDPDGPKDENGNLKPIKQPIFRPGAGDDDTNVDNLLIIGTNGSDDPESDAQYPRNKKFVGDNRGNILLGLTKSDELLGRRGNDVLIGGEGGDRMDGGKGNDQLLGSQDVHQDTYVISEGNDVFFDFNLDSDFVEFDGSLDQLEYKDILFKYQNEETPAVPSTVITVASGDLKGNSATIVGITKEEFVDPKPPIIDPEGNELIPITGGGGGNGGDGGTDGGVGGSGSGSGSGGGNGGEGNSFPGDPDQGGGDDSTIDGEPIQPDADDGDSGEDNTLRVIDVEKKPAKSSFDDVTKGTKKNEQFKGNKQDDKLTGKRGEDTLVGRNGEDYLYGGKNGDILHGRKGSDNLQGHSGRDNLKGGKGKDLLYGAKGGDTLTGGKGTDVFTLSKGKDVITDFNIKKDGIGLVNALDLKFKQKGDDLRIKGNNKVNTLLLNVDKDAFLADFPGNLQIVPAVEVDVF